MIGAHPQPSRAQTALPRTLTIVVHPDGACDIFEGEHFADGLSWDELIGEIARLTSWQHGHRGRYMQHVDRRLEHLLRRQS